MSVEQELNELVKGGKIPISVAKRIYEQHEEEKTQAGNRELIDVLNRIAEAVEGINFRIDRKEGYCARL